MNDLIPMLKLTATHLDMDHMATMAAAAREAVAAIERLAAENAALRAKVERLTPREMTLEEACDVLNRLSFMDHTNWRVGNKGGVPSVDSCCDEFEGDVVRYIAQCLERDAKGGD